MVAPISDGGGKRGTENSSDGSKNGPKIDPQIDPKSTQNRPKINPKSPQHPRRRPKGVPGAISLVFGCQNGLLGPLEKTLGALGGPKKTPRDAAHASFGRGARTWWESPGHPKSEMCSGTPLEPMWIDLSPFWVALGGPEGAFLASFSHLRPKRETLIIHCKIQCFVRVRGSERRPKYVRRSSQKQGPKTRLRKAARARDLTPETAILGAP